MVFALPAVVAGTGFYWFAQSAVVEEVEFEMSLVAAHEEAIISDWIRERRFDLGVIAQVGSINDAVRRVLQGRPGATDSLRYLLSRARLFFGERYSSFRVFSPEGELIHGESESHDRSTLVAALQGSTAVSHDVVNAGRSNSALEFYAPIVEHSEPPKGVLVATVPTTPMFTLLNTPISPVGWIHLFDRHGQVLTSSSLADTMRTSGASVPDPDAVIDPSRDSSQYVRQAGDVELMGSARRVSEMNWVVTVERNRDEALARLAYMRRVLWSVIVAIVLLGGGVAIGMSTLTVRRLERRERELQTTHEQLITADRLASVGMMAASMAHEINNPLTTIKVLIHSLRQRAASNKALETDINIVLSEIDKIKALVLRFLQFARPRDPEFSAVQLEDILSRIAGLIRHQAQSHGILIFEKYDADLGPVWADGSQIGQMFLNILLNAIDATPPGGEVHVSTSVADAERARVTIWNSGPPLPNEIKEQIFEPFFSTKTTGTGLGLSIARTIIEKHGGEISAEGHDDDGTTFTMLLRRRAVHS
ncbi:MAG: hypothetical protein GF341_12660 [candidate division Zixibacteria bacterium]|nr:hypothetical protein [candidate division Zixibacteria bacterium]